MAAKVVTGPHGGFGQILEAQAVGRHWPPAGIAHDTSRPRRLVQQYGGGVGCRIWKSHEIHKYATAKPPPASAGAVTASPPPPALPRQHERLIPSWRCDVLCATGFVFVCGAAARFAVTIVSHRGGVGSGDALTVAGTRLRGVRLGAAPHPGARTVPPGVGAGDRRSIRDRSQSRLDVLRSAVQWRGAWGSGGGLALRVLGLPPFCSHLSGVSRLKSREGLGVAKAKALASRRAQTALRAGLCSR